MYNFGREVVRLYHKIATESSYNTASLDLIRLSKNIALNLALKF